MATVKLIEYAEASTEVRTVYDVTHVTMQVSWPGMAQADVLAGIELLGRAVLPEVGRLTSARTILAPGLPAS